MGDLFCRPGAFFDSAAKTLKNRRTTYTRMASNMIVRIFNVTFICLYLANCGFAGKIVNSLNSPEEIPGTKTVFNLEGRKLMLIEGPKPIDWAEARQSCKNYGGDLASPLTDAELGIIAQYKPESGIAVWLGAQLVDEKDPKKGWKWITGETLPADSEKWPSAAQRDDGEGCLSIWLEKGGYHSHGKIYSGQCKYTLSSYICQFK